MCAVGDIILIESYQHKSHLLTRHSFVVLNVEAGTIEGLNYDFVCNVLSSYKDAEQRAKKLSFPGNFEIIHTDSTIPRGNTKDGYVKAEQLYYFNRDKITYTVIGRLHQDIFNRLVRFIESLEVPLEHVTDNL